MLNSHADGVEEYEDDDEPIELLRLDGVPYPEPELFLGSPELQAGALFLHLRLEVGGSREPYKVEASVVRDTRHKSVGIIRERDANQSTD